MLPVFPSLILEETLIAGNGSLGLGLYKGTYEVKNSIIVENGDGLGTGGVDLRTAAGTFELNTVMENVGHNNMCPDVPTVICTIESPVKCAVSQVLTSSIVDDRGQAGVGATPTSGCTLANSGRNLCTPDFIDDDPETPLRDYHLGPATTCRGSGSADSSVATDYDGEARPRGVGREIGADEID